MRSSWISDFGFRISDFGFRILVVVVLALDDEGLDTSVRKGGENTERRWCESSLCADRSVAGKGRRRVAQRTITAYTPWKVAPQRQESASIARGKLRAGVLACWAAAWAQTKKLPSAARHTQPHRQPPPSLFQSTRRRATLRSLFACTSKQEHPCKVHSALMSCAAAAQDPPLRPAAATQLKGW
eukprot:scaffold1087_cov198-Pinguiococcus_pyrenoidosus.AAC.18